MHFRHRQTDRQTLTSQHKREMYILHLALKTVGINTGLLTYTFTELGDNLTNNDGDIPIAN